MLRSRRPTSVVNSWSVEALGLFAATSVYAIASRWVITAQALQMGTSPTVVDIVATVTTDSYLIVYLLVPWLLVLGARDSSIWSIDLILTRTGSHLQWLKAVAIGGAARLQAVVVCWLLPIVPASAGLALGYDWADLAVVAPSENLISESVALPVAILLAVLSTALFLWSLYMAVVVAGLLAHVAWPWLAAGGLWLASAVNLRVRLPDGVPDLVKPYAIWSREFDVASIVALVFQVSWLVMLLTFALAIRDLVQRRTTRVEQ